MLTSSGPPPPSQYGYTPLHEAARNGHIKIVEYLIENGVAVDVRSSVSPQPTFPRRRRAAVSSRRACSDALSFRHLTGPLRRSHRVQMGLTPLHRAALFGRLGMVDLLLKLGAQIDAQDNVRPPFHPCVCVWVWRRELHRRTLTGWHCLFVRSLAARRWTEPGRGTKSTRLYICSSGGR
jgi:ankyrin repeat protein